MTCRRLFLSASPTVPRRTRITVFTDKGRVDMFVKLACVPVARRPDVNNNNNNNNDDYPATFARNVIFRSASQTIVDKDVDTPPALTAPIRRGRRRSRVTSETSVGDNAPVYGDARECLSRRQRAYRRRERTLTVADSCSRTAPRDRNEAGVRMLSGGLNVTYILH